MSEANDPDHQHRLRTTVVVRRRDDAWLLRTPASDLLPAGESAAVTLRADNTAAGLLVAGTYATRGKFRNLTNGAGTTYRIAVAGKVGASGLVKFTWSFTPAPAASRRKSAVR